jgi:hypothetical protein
MWDASHVVALQDIYAEFASGGEDAERGKAASVFKI